ncbi:MAG: PHP domain-containing protein [candidate division WOR-3 bacterium]
MADLHIHSALSPCGSLEMSPKAIVESALKKELNLIAVTDHNSYENAFYTGKIANKYGIQVLYGMEVQTSEEVHVLAFFDTFESLENFGKVIHEHLPDIPNNPEFFGDQVVVDENDEIVRFEEKLLINSVDFTIDEVVSLIKSYGGLSVLSHVNASHFSIVSQLGFVPQEVSVDALEITYDLRPEDLEALNLPQKFPVITSSDSHYLADIGRGYTVFFMESPSIEEIKKALTKSEGRDYMVFGKHGRIV